MSGLYGMPLKPAAAAASGLTLDRFATLDADEAGPYILDGYGVVMQDDNAAGSPIIPIWLHPDYSDYRLLTSFDIDSVNIANATFHTQTGIDDITEVITTDAAHGFLTGDQVTHSGGTDSPAIGLADGDVVFVNVIDTTNVSVHLTEADAIADTNRIDLTDGATGYTHFLSALIGWEHLSGFGATLTDQTTHLRMLTDPAQASSYYWLTFSIAGLLAADEELVIVARWASVYRGPTFDEETMCMRVADNRSTLESIGFVTADADGSHASIIDPIIGTNKSYGSPGRQSIVRHLYRIPDGDAGAVDVGRSISADDLDDRRTLMARAVSLSRVNGPGDYVRFIVNNAGATSATGAEVHIAQVAIYAGTS